MAIQECKTIRSISSVEGNIGSTRSVKNELASVVIVGPSVCATLNKPGFIDSFDTVVRVNHQHPSDLPELGKRVDIWYHCLAPLRPFTNLMVPLKQAYHTGRGKAKEVFDYWDDNSVPHEDISDFREQLSQEIGCKPNMGLTAIAHLLRQDVRLHITGFTFYQEPYHDGYPKTRFGNSENVHLSTEMYLEQMQMLDWFIENLSDRVTYDDTLHKIIIRRKCQWAANRMESRKKVEIGVIDEDWCCATTEGERNHLIEVRGELFKKIDDAEGVVGKIEKIEYRNGKTVFRETVMYTEQGLEVLTIPTRVSIRQR